MKGKFIVFEGIDGSGKSTQLKKLTERLLQEGHSVYPTFEPTSGPMGKMIREIFKGEVRTNQESIAALFLADRLHHIKDDENGMLKKLDEGYHVICDRYYLSSYAYHGVHTPLEWVIELNSICTELLRPDLNIFIDVDPKTSMDRLSSSRESMEMYETQSNLTNVKLKYQEAFELIGDQENILTINGEQDSEIIAQRVWEAAEKLFNG